MADPTDFPCDLCGETDAVEVPHCREYTNGQPIHICRQCGFVYVRRRRSAVNIAASWTEEIFGSGYTAAIPAVTARLTYVAETVRSQISLEGTRVCEIGAGEGALLDILRGERYGASVFGIEPSPGNGRLLDSAGIPHFTGTIEDFVASGCERGGFDVAAIVWTLENCQDCRAMLAGARELLTDGGHVVVATGSRLLVPFKKPLHTYLSTNPADTNAFRFSANTLHALLTVSGFEVTYMNRFLDHDVLCVIARRSERAPGVRQGDSYLDVYSFFERWHADSKIYFPA